MNPDDFLAAFSAMDEHAEVREEYKRMPFSFAGNKSESLKHILPRLPYLDSFVDVFGGSGVITLNRRPSKLDVYNDRHSGVTAFFRVVRDKNRMQQLIERIALTPHSREEFMWSRDTYYLVQNDEVELAARWYVAMQSSFAGRGRFFGRVTQGKGNIWRKIQENLCLFNDVADRFLTVQIENLDFRNILKDYDSHGTVFVMDPPYIDKNIYDHMMSKKEHAEMCERIFQCKGFVALCGYNNDIYSKYPWDAIHTWEVGDKMTPMTTKTDTSIVKGRDLYRSENQIEYLWIKE